MRKKKPIVPIKERSAKAAGFSCICRAQSFYEKNQYFKSDDYIAQKMIPFSIQLLLKLKVIKLLLSIVPKSTYTYIIARTKFFDSVFENAVKNNFEQIVLFCPGYDSRGIRFLNDNTKTKLFEMDVEATQAKKLKQLQKQKIYIPDDITFIPVDFDNESIKDKLLKSGFKGNRKTLFVLEGAFMVLNKKSISNIFELFHSITGKESEILFDCIDKSMFEDNNKLELISLLDSDDIGNEYFNKNNKKLKRIKNLHYIVHAKKVQTTYQSLRDQII
ncbi:MAG: SAM-dependent methyltransferase [Desulfobacteraceae bacterium]|nr:SAM-dependent methyltransferase [Desulfobacteraceae bacterium]